MDKGRIVSEYDFTLTIFGDDFLVRGVPDFMIEAVGEALEAEVTKVMREAREKIQEFFFQDPAKFRVALTRN